ncbi:MAG: amidohydrolase family protein [Kiritimatiellae bacterium]|nr:amidohydrolase family protein [Kiritimatiellia bacterium]
MTSCSDIPLTDCHVHIHSVEAVGRLGALMERCGVAAVNVAALPKFSFVENAFGILAKALYPGRVYYFGALDYSEPGALAGKVDFAKQAERLLALGADGLKMLEGKPDLRKQTGIALNSPFYDSFYSYLQANGIPLLFHVADPVTFWDPEKVSDKVRELGWFWGDGEHLSKDALHAEVDGLLKKFPNLQIIFSHFYFQSTDIEKAAAILDAHPNVNYDITPGVHFSHFAKALKPWAAFFATYSDRIFFGSDNSPGDEERLERCRKKVNETIRPFLEDAETGFGLERDALERIYGGNFKRLAGERPKKLRLDLAVDACAQFMERADGKAELANDLEAIVRIVQKLTAR